MLLVYVGTAFLTGSNFVSKLPASANGFSSYGHETHNDGSYSLYIHGFSYWQPVGQVNLYNTVFCLVWYKWYNTLLHFGEVQHSSSTVILSF